MDSLWIVFVQIMCFIYGLRAVLLCNNWWSHICHVFVTPLFMYVTLIALSLCRKSRNLGLIIYNLKNYHYLRAIFRTSI